MAGYEVFDNDEVHWRIRKQAAHLTDAAAFAGPRRWTGTPSSTSTWTTKGWY
jgi:hypothetical protein